MSADEIILTKTSTMDLFPSNDSLFQRSWPLGYSEKYLVSNTQSWSLISVKKAKSALKTKLFCKSFKKF